MILNLWKSYFVTLKSTYETVHKPKDLEYPLQIVDNMCYAPYKEMSLDKSEELGCFHFWAYQVSLPSSEHEESSDYMRQTAYVIDQPLACPLIVVSEHERSSDYARQTA